MPLPHYRSAIRVALYACCSVAAIAPAPLGAQSQGRGEAPPTRSALLYHDTVSFWVNSPPGWIIDSDVAKAQGPLAVLYRRGESWRSGDAVMYANVIALEGSGPDALAATIRAEVARWSGAAGDAVVTSLSAIPSDNGQVASVQKFVSSSHGVHEAVAYLRHGGSVPLLVLTARSERAFEHAYPDFRRLVESYGPGPMIRQ
jgi:hypothetical protein